MANNKEQELMEIFLEEASDLIAALSHTLRDWETKLKDISKIADLKRDLHTLKGSARMVGQLSMGSLAHTLETLADAVATQKTTNQKKYFDLFLEGIDQISAMVDALKSQSTLPDPQSIMQKIQMILPQPEKGSEIEPFTSEMIVSKQNNQSTKNEEPAVKVTPEDVLRIRAALIETLSDLSSENSMIRVSVEQLIVTLGAHLQEMKHEIKRLEFQINNLSLELKLTLEQESTTNGLSQQKLHESKVKLITLNEMQNVVKETLIDVLNTIKGLTDAYTMLEALLLNQTRISAELQHRLSDTRLVSFESIIPRLSRITRQVAKELNKEVSFKVENIEGEMDRTLLEQLIPSLEHILRNAIDHGIETSEQRKKLKKPVVGQIVVSFQRTGGMVTIEIKDDGAGIDIEAVRKKAKKLGMLVQDQQFAEEEILRFILEPGFSTREAITEVSGRGVGMDVVNTAIRKLGGTLNIESKWQVGTSIIIRFPFTSSLNRILLLSLHKHVYGVLLSSVNSVISLSSDKIEKTLQEKAPIIEHENKKYSLVYLGFLVDSEKKIHHTIKKRNFPILLYTSAKNDQFAFMVDDILFSRELIVQSLGSQFKLSNECVGVTLLGDGRMVLVLDMETLSEKARIFLGREKTPFQFSSEFSSEISDLPLIMVVDDSISIRTIAEKLLKKNHYRVITAKDGLDALQKLETEIPDLILLDVDMPRMNGLEFGSTIRKDPKYQKIPIIILTARVTIGRIKFSEERQFDGFIEKPYEDTNLLNMIQSLLGSTHEDHE